MNPLDTIRILPPVYPQITEAIIVAEEFTRNAAPLLAAGIGVTYAGVRLLRDRTIALDSAVSMSDRSIPYRSTEKQGKIRRFVGRFVTGTVIVASGTAIISTLDSVSQEVIEGPNRAVEEVITSLGGEGSSLIAQNDEAMFMNKSYVDIAQLDEVAAKAAEEGIKVQPFHTDFFNLENAAGHDDTALMIAVDNETLGFQAEIDCNEPFPVIVDDAADVEMGERVLINGVPAKTSGINSGTSSMNRVSVTTSKEGLTCISGTELPYYGAVVEPGQEARVAEIMREVGLEGQGKGVLISNEDFLASNENFWAKNGAAIFLIAKLLTAVSLGVGAGYLKRSQLQTYESELSFMLLNGSDRSTIALAETMRATRESIVGAAVATPLAIGLPAAFNSAVTGFEAGTNIHNVSLGLFAMALTNITAAYSGVRRLDIMPAGALR